MAIQQIHPGQLAFDLALDDVADDAVERHISAEAARLISETARTEFLNWWRPEKPPEWFDDYLELIEARWPWRVAAYIAWASAPKAHRTPKTLNELAPLLGLTSPRQIHKWKAKYPSLSTVVSLMQSQPLFEHRRDFIEALIASGTVHDYKGFNDRKLAFEMLGDYIPKSQVKLQKSSSKDPSELSEDELRTWLETGELPDLENQSADLADLTDGENVGNSDDQTG